MENFSYEYRGLLAETWDLLRGDTSKWTDGPFYKAFLLDDGQPGLDVGCGTGRLLVAFLAEGLEVEGVDNSPEMLAICQSKAADLGLKPTLYQQSMEQLNLPGKYRTIFIPSSSFQLVTHPAQAMEALSRFLQHLEPGGVLVFSIMDISSDTQTEWKLLVEKERPEDGLTVRRWFRSWFDADTQLQHTENRFELLKDGEILESELIRWSPATQNYALSTITRMLEETGFDQIKAVSLDLQPVIGDVHSFYLSARRP